MALTYTPTPQLGQRCPRFSLKSLDGHSFNNDSFSGAQVLVVLFICGHCPYVQAIELRLIDLARELSPRGVQFVGICSNDWMDHPEDSPENLLLRWKNKNYSFPYLIDPDQRAANDFGAVCTPDIFVYDSDRKLSYRGRFDDSWKDPNKVKRQELMMAIEDTLAKRSLSGEQIPSMGCSIKWKT